MCVEEEGGAQGQLLWYIKYYRQVKRVRMLAGGRYSPTHGGAGVYTSLYIGSWKRKREIKMKREIESFVSTC